MATPMNQCEICFQDGLVRKAIKFCLSCNQPLCEGCIIHHGKFPPLKCHKMLLTSEYDTIPYVVHNLTEFCDDHSEEKKEYVCNNHNACICFLCIKDQHKLCNSIAKLREDDLSKEVESLQGKWASVDDLINRLITLYRKNIQELKSTEKLAQIEIKSLISKVQSQLYRCQKQIETDVIDECSKLNNKIKECEHIKKCIKNDKSEFRKFVEYGNYFKVYIKCKDLEKQHIETDTLVQSLVKKRQHVKLSLNMMPLPVDQIIRFTIQTIRTDTEMIQMS